MRALLVVSLISLLAAQGCALKPASRATAESGSSSSTKNPEREFREPGAARAKSQVLEGRASYYSDRLAGRSTASGEPYDPKKLTAAHRTLKFGTRIRVTRVDTGASVDVIVNDRGPFGDRERIVDLSRRAAEELDMMRAGVVHVRVQVLGP